jgi:deazaflavin-dependent oxidoreductase (nitroreductase family)
MFLYLTTTGRVSGQPREIEIWFTEHGGHFYLIAEHRDRAKWVLNIQAEPQVRVRVGDWRFDAAARVVRDDDEPELTSAVKKLFDAKYGWSDGLVVELKPT